MKYELRVAKLDDTYDTLVYDNDANTLHVKDTNQEIKYIPKENDNNFKDKKNSGICVRVSMGKQCNFKCKYCHQTVSPYKQKKIPDFVDQLLRITNGNISHVQFWGGEPLVFFDTIKELIQEFEEKCEKDKVPDFGFCTNGSLLHGEIAKYILEKNIKFSFSHDGFGQHLRGIDPLKNEETVNLIRSLVEINDGKWMPSFNPVITKDMHDPLEYVNYIENIIGYKIVIGEVRPVIITDEASLESAMDVNILPDYTKKLYKCLVSHDLDNWSTTNGTVQRFMHKLGKPNTDKLNCFVGSKDTLTVDLEGNIITCQSFNYDDVDEYGNKHFMGNICNLDTLNDREWPNLKVLEQYVLEQCKDCLLKNVCKGGCPFTPSKYRKINCRYLWHHNLAIFLYAIHRTIGCVGVITDVSPYILPDFN